MIVNVIFHGAWLFAISEKRTRIFAYCPKETDHKYWLGSPSTGAEYPLLQEDYDFSGVTPGKTVWYPNNEYTPLFSAKSQGLRRVDPNKKRYCYISMPFPEPVNIFPLEPYNTQSFLKGKASTEVKNLKQFPALHGFVYQCPQLGNLHFTSLKTKTDIAPMIKPNRSPYNQTANLHIYATYVPTDYSREEDKKQMQHCFVDMCKLLDPELDLKLNIQRFFKIKRLAYPIPPGVSQEEVESVPSSVDWGPGRNCQNANFFLTETDGMVLP